MNQIYLALDFPTWKKASHFIETNELHGVPVKVGMELFYREGIHVIERLKKANHAVFLDLKLHDIPTTVMRAMRNLAALEVDVVNVHALGGRDMIAKAKEGLMTQSASKHETKLLAVTILTSMDESTIMKDLRLSGTVKKNVQHLAQVAKNGGADGVVCSVHEVEAIKRVCSDSFLTITPGIRLEDSGENDQKRIATPALARNIGTDSIVIGRSITGANNPLQAYKKAVEEWENGRTI